MIFNLPNPIPAQFKDPEDLQDFFKGLSVVPYYGTSENTSHRFLDLLKNLAELSPTFGSIMGDINAYAFGLNLEVTTRNIPGLKTQDTGELQEDAQINYLRWAGQYNIKASRILQVSKKANTHLSICGNAYLLIRRITAGDLVQYYFEVPHFTHCAYVISKDNGELFLLISRYLGDLELLRKYPPRILRATKEGDRIRWNTVGNGIEEAVIHIKNDNAIDDSDYYNRPQLISAMPALYTDYKIGELSSKIAATDLISKKLLAFEAPDPDAIGGDEDPEETPEINNGQIGSKRSMDYFERNAMILKQLVTNMGHHPSISTNERTPSTIATIEYPHGGNPPTAIDLEVNRDRDYHKYQDERSAIIICEALRWAPELISNRPAEATLGGNLMYDIFTIKNQTTIVPIQTKFEDLWNEILEQIHQQENAPAEFSSYGIKFTDLIGSILEKFKGAGTPGQAAVQTSPSANINNQTNEDDGGNDNNIVNT